MKKKTIIYVGIVAVIILGFVISKFANWPVDYDNASGNIAKSTHFNRKTAEGGIENMQELLMNDEDFKNSVVAGYIVMKTRAEQFDALVEMSAEVAGDIKEFESVLKEMKEAQPMVKNACASMESAGKDIDSALGGEAVKDLEQNTSNATLAYNTIQKQNKLADKFIETVDNYLKNNNANDRLKFVRDQWLDYQQMTAALDQDENLAKELSDKGYLLSENKRAAALGSFNGLQQTKTICAASLSDAFQLGNALHSTVLTKVISAYNQLEALGDVTKLESLGNGPTKIETLSNGTKIETLSNGTKLETLSNGNKIMTLSNGTRLETLSNGNKIMALGNGTKIEALSNGHRIMTLENGTKLETLSNGTKIEALRNGTQIEALSNGTKIEALRANELGVQGLRNFISLGGFANLRNAVELSVMSLSNSNKLEMGRRMNMVLSNQWGELQSLSAHQQLEKVNK